MCSSLQMKQSMDLETKVLFSEARIAEWYDRYYGKVYVSFSGGKDSTVLLDLVRRQYPEVPAVFVDTGLEFPEVRDFVRSIKNVIWLKPKKNFKQVIDTYGYPVISKNQSRYLSDLKNPTNRNIKTRETRLNGSIWNGKKTNTGKLSNKYKFLIDAPFKISDKCCDVMKKQPIIRFEKESQLKPFIGVMASDSKQRERSYYSNGCNAFELAKPQSRPLMFWNDSDIWSYIEQNNVSYSDIYNKGYERTGCVFCMYGMVNEKVNRFETLKETHPNIYKYCMEKLGLGMVMNFINNGLDGGN